MNKFDVGVIVGRFQVPEFHAGHKHLLDQVYTNHKAMLVFLGTSAVQDISDPLDFSLRQQMIKDLYPDATVLMAMDYPSDAGWSNALDNLIEFTFPNRTVCLYGGRDSFIAHYVGRHATSEVEQFFHSPSGSELRNNIDSKHANADFRRGMIYALRYSYPSVMPTVDIALINLENQVLMGRKNNLSGLIFPGGFVSPKDESFEHAATRELLEETGMCLVNGVKSLRYITSMPIDDWRYKNRRDKIFTTFYRAEYFSGVPKAGDDLHQVEWLTARGENIKHVAEHHRPLFERLLEVM